MLAGTGFYMIKQLDAYVKLLDEGIAVWRPCKVFQLDESTAIVSSFGYDFNNSSENWECRPGDLVKLVAYDNNFRIARI